MIQSVRRCMPSSRRKLRGVVTIEYLLLLTLVGIGVIVGLSSLRQALIDELQDLAAAINAIT
jgi:pilus assembly protein Flp/PilA